MKCERVAYPPRTCRCEKCKAHRAAGEILYLGRWRTRPACVVRILQEKCWRGATVRAEGNAVVIEKGRARMTFPFEDAVGAVKQIEGKGKDTCEN